MRIGSGRTFFCFSLSAIYLFALGLSGMRCPPPQVFGDSDMGEQREKSESVGERVDIRSAMGTSLFW